MEKIALINGRLVDPFQGIDEKRNVLIINGKIVGLGYIPDEKEEELEIIDLEGAIIVPNIMDIGANLGEPGAEDHETITSGSEAASKAGITAIACSPDTPHTVDTPEKVSFIINTAKVSSKIPIYPLAAVTKECKGQELAELALMKKAGAVAFFDKGSILNLGYLKNALIYSSMLDLPVIIGPNAKLETNGAVMNNGAMSTILGLKGSPKSDEEIMIQSIIQLFQYIKGGKLHFSHISTKGAVEIIQAAKDKGLAVTSGTSPQYLHLTDKAIEGYNTDVKINPPLRAEEDVKALIKGLKDGTIDVISSQHIPCTVDDKRCDFTQAAFGMSGLDLFIPLILTKLYHQENLPLETIFKKITQNPCNLLGLKPEPFALNSSPDFTVIHLDKEKQIATGDIVSHGKHTPFIGQKLKGFAKHLFVKGKLLK